MKRLTIITVFIFFAFGGTTIAYAFPLNFAYMMCTMDQEPLTEEVHEFGQKWLKVRRKPRASQYRKHIERHVDELLEAFDNAAELRNCSTERKVVLNGLRKEFQALLEDRPKLNLFL